MNEAKITSELMAYLRERPGHPVCLKHADKSTVGIPDLSVTLGGTTAWVEVKYEKRARKSEPLKLEKVIEEGGTQHRTVMQLGYRGPAFWLVFVHYEWERRWENVLFSPADLKVHLPKPVSWETVYYYRAAEGKGFPRIWEAILNQKEYQIWNRTTES